MPLIKIFNYKSSKETIYLTRISSIFYIDLCTCVLQAFAFLGFTVAVIWIESIANEIVNILTVSFYVNSPLISIRLVLLVSITCQKTVVDLTLWIYS